MATSADVARLAGVSRATVSRIINDSAPVSDEIRTRVQASIDMLGYKPNSIAQHLVRRQVLERIRTVGVLAPFSLTYSVVERLRAISETLHETPFDLTLFNVDAPAQLSQQLHQLTQRDRADGIIIISLPLSDDYAQRFSRNETPVVLVDVAHPLFPHIVIDNLQGGKMAAQYLIALGHRRLAFIGDQAIDPYGFTSSHDRFAGFAQALDEAEIALRPEYVKAGPHSRHIAHRLTNELLALPEPPTAIFAASDNQALGILEALRNADIAVPQQISVIGFDDIEVAPYLGLTTVRQPLHASGVRGTELLLSYLEGAAPHPLREILPLELIVRETTGRHS
jgi:LacI family transcriptional regulator